MNHATGTLLHLAYFSARNFEIHPPVFSSGSFVLLVEFHPTIQRGISIRLWMDLGLLAVFRCCECLCRSDSWVGVFVSLDYVETWQRDFWLAQFNGCLTLRGRDKLFCKEVVLFCIPPGAPAFANTWDHWSFWLQPLSWGGCAVAPSCDFNLRSSDEHDVEYFFTSLVGTCTASLVGYVFIPFIGFLAYCVMVFICVYIFSIYGEVFHQAYVLWLFS